MKRQFGRGTTRSLGDLLTGMILQVGDEMLISYMGILAINPEIRIPIKTTRIQWKAIYFDLKERCHFSGHLDNRHLWRQRLKALQSHQVPHTGTVSRTRRKNGGKIYRTSARSLTGGYPR